MVLDSYLRPETVEIAIKEMAEKDQEGISKKINTRFATVEKTYQSVAKRIWDAGFPCSWRYPYSVERGTLDLPEASHFKIAVYLAHHELFNPKKKRSRSTDPRPGAIRLAYPDGLDGHRARQEIIDTLSPLQRYLILMAAVVLKRKKPK